MMLAHPLWSAPITFPENQVQVLTIERPEAFCQTLNELSLQADGANGLFVLSEKDKTLEGSVSFHILTDFSHLQPTEKRLSTKLQAMAQSIADEDLQLEALQLRQAMQTFLGKVVGTSDFTLAYDENGFWQAFLKSVGFHLDFEEKTCAEALAEHMLVFHRFFKHQLFILVNAKSWFSTEELERIYQTVLGNKVNLLLIESTQRSVTLPQERHRLIDSDLCELGF